MHQFRIEDETPINPMGGMPLLYLQTHADLRGLDTGTKVESNFSLADILENEEYKGKTTLTYEYDMGDSWQHQIYLLGRADEHLGKAIGVNKFDQQIACIGGEGHGCAEDCGGIYEWQDLKDMFKKTRGGEKDMTGTSTIVSMETRRGWTLTSGILQVSIFSSVR